VFRLRGAQQQSAQRAQHCTAARARAVAKTTRNGNAAGIAAGGAPESLRDFHRFTE